MRGKSLALLMLALGCGLVASIGITQVMAKRGGEETTQQATDTVFVAVRNIPLGEVLNPQLVRAEQYPKDKLPAGAITKLEDLDGRRTRQRLFADEPILKAKLLVKGDTNQYFSQIIPSGMRVVPLRVDAVSGNAGMLLPGDRVDVLVHLKPDPVAGIREPVTRTILQYVKVFAADNVVNLDGLDNENKGVAAKTISLLVTPEQAQKVITAAEMGVVRLVMRSQDDTTENDVSATLASSMLAFDSKTVGQMASVLGLGGPPQPKPEGGDGKSFLSVLGEVLAKKARAAAEQHKPADPPTAAVNAVVQAPPPAEEKEHFTVRLMLGTRLSEVELTRCETRPGDPSSGYWKSSEPEGSAEPPPAANQTDPPAAKPAAAPANKPADKPGQAPQLLEQVNKLKSLLGNLQPPSD